MQAAVRCCCIDFPTAFNRAESLAPLRRIQRWYFRYCPLYSQGVLKSVVEVEDAAVKLKQEREELRQRFTAEHPTVQAVDAKLARLNDRRKQFEGEVSRLPETQQTVLRLARDVEVSTKLYTELLNTAQQLKVSKAGTVGDVRIIDNAVVARAPIGGQVKCNSRHFHPARAARQPGCHLVAACLAYCGRRPGNHRSETWPAGLRHGAA
ncbi:MAG: GNVR domain-containing protein [Candidatus Accumulibacter necessarius]